MLTEDDIRRLAMAFPEVEEVAHFGRPSFKVRGRPFAGTEKSERTAVFSVGRDEGAAAVAAEPDVYEEVWRPGGRPTWVGLRVDLAKVPGARVAELVEHAWREKAPKRLVAAYDAAN